jgi:glycosyltransferase involved in cell wall biosynthesis
MNFCPRVLVVQYGARRRYAVPRLMQRMGFLSKLITGPHSQSSLGKIAYQLSMLGMGSSSKIKSILNRKIEEIPLSKIQSLDIWCLWQEFFLEKLRDDNPVKWLYELDKFCFSQTKSINLEEFDIFYSMNAQNLSLLKKAKYFGVKNVIDVFISPLALRQIYHEKSSLGMSPNLSEVAFSDFESYYKEVYKSADILLCPSQWVADGVIALDNQFERKICICPYGSSLQFTGDNRKSIEGRIFWAGGDWFRKGLHHLAATADILKSKYSQLDFRIAGVTDTNVQKMLMFKNLNFLGKLNRIQMEEEFSTADMFVFPTLTEGMAGVVIEAITSGCPVITTRGAGVDALEYGKGGLILDSVSPDCLSTAIESLLLDRPRLLQMSDECKELAKSYTEDAWGLRLKQVIDFSC